jgi:hypothetical protein
MNHNPFKPGDRVIVVNDTLTDEQRKNIRGEKDDWVRNREIYEVTSVSDLDIIVRGKHSPKNSIWFKFLPKEFSKYSENQLTEALDLIDV